jgi:hypothetical protein
MLTEKPENVKLKTEDAGKAQHGMKEKEESMTTKRKWGENELVINFICL